MSNTTAHMSDHAAPSVERLHACGEAIARIGASFATRGWTPATSSNFSMRLDARSIAITISGRDKGALAPGDVMAIDPDGRPYDAALRPSAETALHLQIYRRFPSAQSVLHTHSHYQTVASRFFAQRGAVILHGWELQKAIAGQTTHDADVTVPVFPNSQDMAPIMAQVDAWLDAGKPLAAYLIAGHGLYTWGSSIAEAARHVEALDFLLGCKLDLERLGGTA